MRSSSALKVAMALSGPHASVTSAAQTNDVCSRGSDGRQVDVEDDRGQPSGGGHRDEAAEEQPPAPPPQDAALLGGLGGPASRTGGGPLRRRASGALRAALRRPAAAFEDGAPARLRGGGRRSVMGGEPRGRRPRGPGRARRAYVSSTVAHPSRPVSAPSVTTGDASTRPTRRTLGPRPERAPRVPGARRGRGRRARCGGENGGQLDRGAAGHGPRPRKRERLTGRERPAHRRRRFRPRPPPPRRGPGPLPRAGPRCRPCLARPVRHR